MYVNLKTIVFFISAKRTYFKLEQAQTEKFRQKLVKISDIPVSLFIYLFIFWYFCCDIY